MSNKIYVITAGDYSDYHICGVTSDPVRAEQMKEIVSADLYFDEAQIEVFEDGVFKEERMNSIVPKEYWRVFWFSNKPPAFRKYTADSLKEKLFVIGGQKKDYSWEFNENGYPRREIFYEYTVSGIVAEDEEHALKIATDKIAEYKAQKENITC